MIEVWMNKETGNIVIASMLYTLTKEILTRSTLGCFSSIGYGVENEHGVMFVFPEEVKNYFEVIGEF